MNPDDLPVPEEIRLALSRLQGEGWDDSANAVWKYLDAQAKQIETLNDLLTCFDCGKRIGELNPIMDSEGIYQMGGMFFDPGDPGNREEPPTPSAVIFHCIECLDADIRRKEKMP